MSQRLTVDLEQLATITTAPPRTVVDRNFGLPTGLYVATVGAYFAFLAVMAGAFMNATLAIPMAIFAVYIGMAFGVPTVWTRMKPDHRGAALTWGQFRNRGIVCDTGAMSAGEASVQVLMLPVLILFFGVCVAVIAALV